MATREEIQQLIEDLDDLEYFPDAFNFTPAHFAALELIRLGGVVFDPVLAALQQHPKYVVRGWAAWILGELGDKQAIPALQTAARGDPHHHVRYEAQSALLFLGAMKTSPPQTPPQGAREGL